MRCINCWLGTVGLVFLCLLAFKGKGVFGSGIAGSGVNKSEPRQVETFNSIRLDGIADVETSISDHTEVIVSADDNLLPLIETNVSESTLVISEKKNISPKTNIKVTIKTPGLKSASVSGAGNFSVKGLSEPSFDVNVRGAGNISAAGQVDALTARLSGVGNINLFDLAAKTAIVSVSGAGSAKITSIDTLNVSVSGVGNVTYKGSPKLTEQVSGVGSVTNVP